jgi:hypothetical protein
MPFGERQVELHAFRPSDRDPEASRLAVEPIGLILRFEHELAHVRDRGPLLSLQASSMSLQSPQGDLEGGGDVLLVESMAAAHISVSGADESGSRSDVRLKGDADRLVDKETELGQEPVQLRGIPPDLEGKGPVKVHLFT